MHFYIIFDNVCNPHAVWLFITGTNLCAPNGVLAYVSWRHLSSRCHSWCSYLSLAKAAAFPFWMPCCLCSVLATETMNSLSVFTGSNEGTSVLVSQKEKIAFKVFVQEKHGIKWHLSVKMEPVSAQHNDKTVNSSYLFVNDTHTTYYFHSLKVVLGSMKCSATIYAAIKLVHIN